MKKCKLLTLILSGALLGVNLNINAVQKRTQPDNPSGQSRRQEKRPRTERPAAQPVLTERSIQKLQILDQQLREFLHDLELLNRNIDPNFRSLFDSRVDTIHEGIGILTEIINQTTDRPLIQFLEETNNIFSETTEALNKAYHCGANPAVINPLLAKSLLAKSENIKRLATEIIRIQNSAPIIEDVQGDQGSVTLPGEPKVEQQTGWIQRFTGFFSHNKKAEEVHQDAPKFVKPIEVDREDLGYLNLGIDQRKLNILLKRLTKFYRKLEELSKQKNDFLRQELITKEYLPFLKTKVDGLVLLIKRKSNIEMFYSAFKNLEEQMTKHQISQTLELLHEDEVGNSLLNRTMYLNNKIQDLLKRNYSPSQRIEDEFSDASDSEVEDNKRDPQEESAELIQSKIQKYKNLRKAKSDDANLVELDLSGLDLSNLDLSNKDLSGANFRNANLSNTKFNGSNLTNAIFENAIFENTDLTQTNISRVNFSNVFSWNNVKLDEIKEAQGSNLSGLNLQNIKFADEADFTDAILNEADLTNASLNGAKLLKTQLNKVTLNGAKLNKAIFNEAKLKEAKLHKTELREAVIINSDLTKAEIVEAKVEHIKIHEQTLLTSAILSNLHFDLSTLANLNTEHITIINTSFFKCTFQDLNMKNASLHNVSFEKTTLKNIDLSDSIIEKFIIKNISLICDTLYFTNSKLTECFFIGKITENKDKRKAFFQKHTIEDHHKFYSDSDFQKIYSLMKFCDFSLAKLKNVYFTNILFGLRKKPNDGEVFSARKNLGDISQIESVIFCKTYFYKYVAKEGTFEANKTKEMHEKFANMLRHKGAIVNQKISEAYKLYLETQLSQLQNPVSSGVSNAEMQGWVNTGANVLGNVGSATGSAMQGYAALQTAKATAAALAAAQGSGALGVGTGAALAAGTAGGLGVGAAAGTVGTVGALGAAGSAFIPAATAAAATAALTAGGAVAPASIVGAALAASPLLLL